MSLSPTSTQFPSTRLYFANGGDIRAVNPDELIFGQVLHDAHQVVVVNEVFGLGFNLDLIFETLNIDDFIEHHFDHALVYFEENMVRFGRHRSAQGHIRQPFFNSANRVYKTLRSKRLYEVVDGL